MKKYGSGKNPACPSFSNEVKNPGRGDAFFNGIKNLPVILERSEESGQRLEI